MHHSRATQIVNESREYQTKIFKKWLALTAVLLSIFQPLNCVLRFDFGLPLSNAVLLIPSTISWCALLICLILQAVCATREYRRVRYRVFINAEKFPRGHNFKHPTTYNVFHFTDKMIASI